MGEIVGAAGTAKSSREQGEGRTARKDCEAQHEGGTVRCGLGGIKQGRGWNGNGKIGEVGKMPKVQGGALQIKMRSVLERGAD